MSLLNWEKTKNNRVKDLSFNKAGRYGTIYQWKHKTQEFYITVRRHSKGHYEIMKGESQRTRNQEPLKKDFIFSNYEDAGERAREWMENNPDPKNIQEEEITI